MKTTRLFWGLLLLAACAGPEVAQDAEYGTVDSWAEEIPVPVDAVVAEPYDYLERTIAVSGTIHEVCQMDGCWLMLRALEGQAGVRVHVKRGDNGGYAFTVPTDVSGRYAVAYGEIQPIDTESEAHYQEDAPGAVPELNMMAEGVRIAQDAAI